MAHKPAAWQDLLADETLGKDASGNTILADVGPWLRDQFKTAFKVIVHGAPGCTVMHDVRFLAAAKLQTGSSCLGGA